MVKSVKRHGKASKRKPKTFEQLKFSMRPRKTLKLTRSPADVPTYVRPD